MISRFGFSGFAERGPFVARTPANYTVALVESTNGRAEAKIL
jgi:hypothetical protein